MTAVEAAVKGPLANLPDFSSPYFPPSFVPTARRVDGSNMSRVQYLSIGKETHTCLYTSCRLSGHVRCTSTGIDIVAIRVLPPKLSMELGQWIASRDNHPRSHCQQRTPKDDITKGAEFRSDTSIDVPFTSAVHGDRPLDYNDEATRSAEYSTVSEFVSLCSTLLLLLHVGYVVPFSAYNSRPHEIKR